MKFLDKKCFVFIIGLIFVSSLSLDSLYHGYIEGESSQIECQFCKNEVTGSIQSKVGIATVSLSTILKTEINKDFISSNLKNFYSRAPPLNKI